MVIPDDYPNIIYTFVANCPTKDTIYTFQGKTYRLPDDKVALCDALYPGTGKVFIKDNQQLSRVSITFEEYDIPDDIFYLSASAFSNCDLITDITILGNIKNVGEYIYNFSTKETRVGAPFNNCANLKTITLAEGVTTLSALAVNCPNLSTVNLPSTLTEIGEHAFGMGYGGDNDLSALKEITLPDSVTKISTKAFPSTIESVTYKGKTYKSNQFPNLYKAVNGN